MHETMLSSPDPLNDSPTYHSPVKPRRSLQARQSLPLLGNSPNKQTFELDVGNSLSPQKIRVTVEAGEPSVGNAHPGFNGTAASPAPMPKNRRREGTTTTTTTVTKVPLRGLSDSEDAPQAIIPKRGRGRPRKSTGTPVPTKKPGRASTPTHNNRRKSIGSLVDDDDDELLNAPIGNGVEVGRGKGRSKSRSRSTKGRRTSTMAARDPTAAPKPASTATNNKGKGCRKALVPEEVEVLEDDSYQGRPKDQERDSGEYENDGAPEPIDSNSQNQVSQYSTIRSCTAVGRTEADVVIARFDPGDETPRRPGWSSPHILDALQFSGSRPRADSHPSSSGSPAKSTYEDDPDSGRQGYLASDHNDYDEDHYNEDDGDEIDQYADFDTILESEGFSMISVDSVPSLREHFSSSPANQSQKQQSIQGNKSLRTIAVQEDVAAYEDSFSAIPETVLNEATPARKPHSSKLLSVQQARADDSFSSIPHGVPRAATLTRKSQLSKLISQNTPSNDSFSSVAPEILEAATPHRKLPDKKLLAIHSDVNDQYKYSFSAPKTDNSDAATQAAVGQIQPSSDRLNGPVPRLSVSPSQAEAISLAPTRLLTPEETPSPPTDGSHGQLPGPSSNAASQFDGQASAQVPGEDSSLTHSHMASSPPSIATRRYTYTAHLRHNRQLNLGMAQTPSIVFSSPKLPPPIRIGRGMPTLAPPSEQAERPGLSPIVRAGRMLQDILVPSSSRSRSQSLGSPFKSPAADRRSSSLIAQESYPSPVHERLAGPLPRLDLSGHFEGSSSQRHSRSSQQDDPFRNSAKTQHRSPSPKEKHHVRSDDAMSWQAEQEVSVRGSGALSLNSIDLSRMSEENRWATERAAVIREAASANSSKVIVIDSEDAHSKNGQDEDEDFGLLLETLNSSPVVERREAPKEIFEMPRRSKLPSPWRKNSKRLVYSDDLCKMASSPPEAIVPLVRSFGKQIVPEPATVRRIVPQELSDDLEVDFSEYQIPQKANFNPHPRESGNLDLSALLGTSPPNALPTLSSGPHKSIFQRQPRLSQASKVDPDETSTMKFNEAKVEEPAGFKPIPQKMGFNPRPRAESSAKISSTVPALFGGSSKPTQTLKYPEPESSSPICTPLATAPPSRTNLIQASRTPLSVDVSPDCSLNFKSSNRDKENQAVTNSRTIKWTESFRLDTTADVVLQTPLPPLSSPTKSCLRSPIKTPTAGSGNLGSSDISPSKAVTFVPSSPSAESLTDEPLSATVWSKDHWRLLDNILQTWKPENNVSPFPSDEKENSARRRRNSTRVISRLLGKNVFSGDQKMKLEQWHLEAVDEFRGCVPGWQEKVVAMRLFALLVGEERRAKGLVGSGKIGNYDHLN